MATVVGVTSSNALPAGWAANDVALYVVQSDSSVSTPSGWTLVDSVQESQWTYAFRRVLQSGDTAPAVLGSHQAMHVYRGVGTTTPIRDTGTASNPFAASVTATVTASAGDWIVYAGGAGASPRTATPPSGYTERTDQTGSFRALSTGDSNGGVTAGDHTLGPTWDPTTIRLIVIALADGGAGSVPGQVTGLSATAASSSQINLSWTAPSGATSYKIERSPNGSTGWTEIASGHTGTSYGDTGLSASTTYHYRVRATNTNGDGAYSTTANATTSGGASVPGQVTGLSATAASSSQINLSWTAPAGATSYKIERSPTGSGSWTQIASGHTGTSYGDTGLAVATTWYYRVRATNTAGDGSYSSVVNATTFAAGSPPAAPTGLSALATGPNAISLYWTPPSGASAQRIERSPNGSTGWVVVVEGLSGGASSYTDGGLTPATAAHYRLQASNSAGASSYSSVATATTQAAATGQSYAASTSWRWIEASRPLLDRMRTITLAGSASAGTTLLYLATSRDGTTWSFWSGALTAGRLLASAASQAAAETNAVSLAALAGTRLDLPAITEARFVRVYWRNTTGATTWREFYPRRLVQTDDLEAESIRSIHLGSKFITADHIFGTQLSAIFAELGIVTLGINGGLWQGTGTFASPTTGLKIWNAAGVGRLATYNGGQVQVELDSDGSLSWAGGKGRANASGFFVDTTTNPPLSSSYTALAALTFMRGASRHSYVQASIDTLTNEVLKLWVEDVDGYVLIGPELETGRAFISNGLNIGSRGGAGGNVGLWTNKTINIGADGGGLFVGGDGDVPDGQLWVANGISVGGITGASAGEIKARALNLYNSALDRRLGLGYDSANDYAYIYALQDGVAWKTLFLQALGNGNIRLCESGTVGVRTAPLAQQALRVLGTGGTSSDYLLALINSNGTSSLLVQGNNVHQISSTGWGGISDRREKTAIRPLAPGALDRFMQWELVTFGRRAHPGARRELGLIAQQLQPISPHLVYEAAEADPKRRRQGGPLLGVMYTEAAMEHAAAFQEYVRRTDAELASLRALVESLRGRFGMAQ